MNDLQDPLTRLTSLPTQMNWRNVWGNTTQYYKNDVAVSPTNNASYILFGKTTDLGQDPISNVAWFELFPHTTGLHQLTAGTDITISPVPSPQTPTITNVGVRTLTTTVGGGLGTFGGQNPLVFNTGILGLNTNGGLSWDASTSTLTNTGLITTARIGIANTGTAQNQVWSNQGIVGLNAGGNITVSVSSNTATIGNTGVLTIAGGGGILRSGPPSQPTLSVRNYPILNLVVPTGGMTPTTLPATAGSTGVIPVSLSPSSLLAQQLAAQTAAPDPNPFWKVDLTGWWFDYPNSTPNLFPPSGLFDSVIIYARDTTTAGNPQVQIGSINVYPVIFAGQGFTNLGLGFVNLNAMIGAGLRTITEIVIENQLQFPLRLDSWNEMTWMYYPNFYIN